MLPDDEHIQDMIFESADNGLAVAELEYLGLSLRVVNTLEQKVGVVYLQDLLSMSEEDIANVRQLGSGAIKQISDALARFPELEQERSRWSRGSDRTEYYKQRVNTRAILA
jgi:DNA-directed RNA polymerase alpha subunit